MTYALINNVSCHDIFPRLSGQPATGIRWYLALLWETLICQTMLVCTPPWSSGPATKPTHPQKQPDYWKFQGREQLSW